MSNEVHFEVFANEVIFLCWKVEDCFGGDCPEGALAM